MNEIRIHDLSTDKIIDRQMNKKELEEAEALAAESIASFEAKANKAAERAAILERLGITAEEAQILLG